MTPAPVRSLWIGERLGPMQRLSIESFLRNGHPIELFAYDHVAGVPAGTTICDAGEVLPRERVFSYQHGFGKGSYSAFSNLFRYQLLLDRGGWWVDTDVVCLRPFDFAADYVFASEYNDDFVVNAATCVLKAPARAPMLDYCVQVCTDSNKSEVKWGELGPSLLDAAIARFGLTAYLTPVHVFNPINWFDTSDMLAPGFDAGRLKDSHGIHLWNQMWKHEGREPRDASPDSLFAYLSSRFPGAADALDVP
jgi:hypothetical protein